MFPYGLLARLGPRAAACQRIHRSVPREGPPNGVRSRKAPRPLGPRQESSRLGRAARACARARPQGACWSGCRIRPRSRLPLGPCRKAIPVDARSCLGSCRLLLPQDRHVMPRSTDGLLRGKSASHGVSVVLQACLPGLTVLCERCGGISSCKLLVKDGKQGDPASPRKGTASSSRTDSSLRVGKLRRPVRACASGSSPACSLPRASLVRACWRASSLRWRWSWPGKLRSREIVGRNDTSAPACNLLSPRAIAAWKKQTDGFL